MSCIIFSLPQFEEADSTASAQARVNIGTHMPAKPIFGTKVLGAGCGTSCSWIDNVPLNPSKTGGPDVRVTALLLASFLAIPRLHSNRAKIVHRTVSVSAPHLRAVALGRGLADRGPLGVDGRAASDRRGPFRE